MDGQTTMNRNGTPTGNEPGIRQSFSGLAHDVIELGELQAKLLMMDLHASTARVRATIVLAVLGVAVLLGCFPVVLLTVVELLVTTADWSRVAAYACVSFVSLAVCAILFAVAWAKVRHGLSTFDRSREELRQNLAWVKTSLRTDSKQPTLSSPRRDRVR
jgi:hypothetical protein